VNGRTVGIFGVVHYIMGVCCVRVSVKWGSTVKPYSSRDDFASIQKLGNEENTMQF